MTRPTLEIRLGLALAIGVFAVVACAGGGPPTAAPGGSTPVTGTAAAPATIPRACDLLTDADIEELTGTTVVSKDDNVADTIYFANHCRWTVRRPDGGNGTMDLGIMSPDGRELYDHTGGPSGLEPVDGLPADDAGIYLGAVYAVRGDTLVDVYTPGLALSTSGKVGLARRVLERLFGLPLSTAAQGADSAIDACDLLTDEQILAVTGYTASGHEGFPVGNALWDATCTWQVDSGEAVPATITVNIKSPRGRASWDQYMVPFQETFTAIDALGDAAFGKPLWPTNVLSGDTYVGVKFVDMLDPKEFSTELARRVVANLGG